jgi:hypothetical protein
MMVYLLAVRPIQSLAGLATSALGVLLYFGATKPFHAGK